MTDQNETAEQWAERLIAEIGAMASLSMPHQEESAESNYFRLSAELARIKRERDEAVELLDECLSFTASQTRRDKITAFLSRIGGAK